MGRSPDEAYNLDLVLVVVSLQSLNPMYRWCIKKYFYFGVVGALLVICAVSLASDLGHVLISAVFVLVLSGKFLYSLQVEIFSNRDNKRSEGVGAVCIMWSYSIPAID